MQVWGNEQSWCFSKHTHPRGTAEDQFMPPSRVPCSAVTGGCRPTSYGVKGNFYAGKEMGLTSCKYISFSYMYSVKKGSAEGEWECPGPSISKPDNLKHPRPLGQNRWIPPVLLLCFPGTSADKLWWLFLHPYVPCKKHLGSFAAKYFWEKQLPGYFSEESAP